MWVVPQVHGPQNLAIRHVGIHSVDLVLEVEVIQLLVLDVNQLLRVGGDRRGGLIKDQD